MKIPRLPGTRGVATTVAVALLTAAGTAACAGNSTAASSSAATAPSTARAPSTTHAPSTAHAASTATARQRPAEPGQVVAITLAGGEVSRPGGRVTVARGSTVTLQVTSDVADEVHLHGYDLRVDVGQGGTATLTFQATLTGVFEVELESRGLQLVQLQVQ